MASGNCLDLHGWVKVNHLPSDTEKDICYQEGDVTIQYYIDALDSVCAKTIYNSTTGNTSVYMPEWYLNDCYNQQENL